MAGPFVAFLESTAPRMAAAFASMVQSTLSDRSTVFYLADKGQYLWKTLIPSASQKDAATRYGAVALSSLHQSIESAQPIAWQNQPFARYYNNALATVKEGRFSTPHDGVLLPCILFAHYELLMGNTRDAVAHILSGTKIISGMRSGGQPLPDVVSGVIEPILNAFVATSQLSGQNDIDCYLPITTHRLLQELPSMPASFSSLVSAGSTLNDVLYQTLLLQELGQPCDRYQAAAIRKYANNWSIAFDAFRFASGHDTSEMQSWNLLLLAEHRMIQLLLKSMPPEADANFRRATTDFRVMLAQLKTFLRKRDQEIGIKDDTNRHQPITSGYIMPLFFISLHCHVHEIQSAALDLLRDLNVVEGQWNSCLAHAIASRVADLSEKQMQRIRPSKMSDTDSTRIKPISLERAGGGRLRLQYMKLSFDGKSGEAGEALIEQQTCHQNVNPSWVSMETLSLGPKS